MWINQLLHISNSHYSDILRLILMIISQSTKIKPINKNKNHYELFHIIGPSIANRIVCGVYL